MHTNRWWRRATANAFEQNPMAPWELRVRNMRVFYEVDEPGVVTVLAIGTKRGNRLYIEGEEMEL